MTDLAPGMLAAPNIVLEKKLADGGMGSVWVAEHTTLKTRVAVKFVLATLGNEKDAAARFEREATAIAHIKSPHIVQVLDYGRSDAAGRPYIVMELLEGEDLGSRIEREGPLPLSYVANVVSQAAKALGKAHQAGVVHRDIKPDNLFLVDPEGDVFVKVLDFGIAKWSEPSLATMTSTGSLMGTPHFMAPEQMTSSKNVAPESDLWALGVVAYNALTAKVPFDGETMAALAIALHEGAYKLPTEHVPSLPREVDAWMNKALARNPADRFATAKELADALLAIAGLAPVPTVSILGSPSRRASPLAATKLRVASDADPKGEVSRATAVTMSRSRQSDPPSTRSRLPALAAVVALAAVSAFGYAHFARPAQRGATTLASTTLESGPVPTAFDPAAVPPATAPSLPVDAPDVSAEQRARPSASASASPAPSSRPRGVATKRDAAPSTRKNPDNQPPATAVVPVAPPPSVGGEIPTTF